MGKQGRPLRSDPAVRELLALMRAHNSPGQEDFLAVLREVERMEQQLASAVEELAAMRKELAQAREGPVKRALTKAVQGLERGVSTLTERLNALRESIVDSCRQAVAAFRERGASALAQASQFLHIRSALGAVSRAADYAIGRCEKSAAQCREISATYREAGRHLKNAGRVMAGLEPVTEASAPGRLVRAVEAVCEKEKALHGAVKQGAERAGAAVTRLEQAARRPPSIRDTMRDLQEKIAREQAEKPAPAVELEGRDPDGR